MRQLGWFLVLSSSLMIVLIPSDFSTLPLTGDMLLLTLLFLLAALLIGLLGSVALLFLAYRESLRQPWIMLFLTGLVAVAAVLSNSGLLESELWVLQKLALLLASWGLVAMIALGMAVLAYLIYQDHSVVLVMLTYLALVWVFVFYLRQQGPAQLLQNSLSATAGRTLPLLPPLYCLAFWLALIAPFSFIGHTLLLLHAEWSENS